MKAERVCWFIDGGYTQISEATSCCAAGDGLSFLVRRTVWDVFEQLTYRNAEIAAQGVDRIQINSCSRLLVEQRDGVPMETSVPRKVADLELSFSHKPGQVTLDQDILHVEISLRTTKSH